MAGNAQPVLLKVTADFVDGVGISQSVDWQCNGSLKTISIKAGN